MRPRVNVIYGVIAAAVLCTALLTSCRSSAPAAQPEDQEEAIRIPSMEDYNSKFDPAHIDSRAAWDMFSPDSKAIMLDVRSEASYLENHVAASVNVPYEEIEKFARENIPDKDTLIICYCFCDDKGGSALSACRLLTELGYTRAFYTEPGDEWTYKGTSSENREDRENIENIEDIEDSINTANTGGDDMNGQKTSSGHIYITGQQAKEMYEKDDKVILLDVRNSDEFADGHIEGSTLIPVSELQNRLNELPDKQAAIIVYCRSGMRSGNAYKILQDNGYSNISDMQKVTNWPEPLAAG